MDRNSTGNLTVQVRLHDSIVGRGVENVSVRIVSTKPPTRHFESPATFTEKTSFRGDALFKDIPLGQYDVHVEADGYTRKTVRAAVRIPGPDPQGHFVTPHNAVPVKLEVEMDSSKWPQDTKFQSMNSNLRPKVKAVLAALTKRGFRPTVFYAWRSHAVQLKLLKDGTSKVDFSFHNAKNPDGTFNSYAADIIDSRYLWAKQAETSGFWKALGEEAKKQGLYWGGDWKSYPDPAHVQLLDSSELPRIKKENGL